MLCPNDQPTVIQSRPVALRDSGRIVGRGGIYYDPEVMDHFLSVVSPDVFKYQPWEEHDGFLEKIFPSERFVQLFSGK